MSDHHTYKKVELVGSSATSIEDAINNAIAEANKSIKQLPEGAVLVVGAGASGSQIAEELQKAGKTVYLSVGEHYRPPRAYRGRDYCWWLGALGLWDEVKIQPKKKHVAFAVSGYEGGKTVDFRRLAHQGIQQVQGDLVFDDTFFDAERLGTDWSGR